MNVARRAITLPLRKHLPSFYIAGFPVCRIASSSQWKHRLSPRTLVHRLTKVRLTEVTAMRRKPLQRALLIT